MARWTKAQREESRRLAVAYETYCSAAWDNIRGKATWAEILLSAQENIGVELINPDNLRYYIERANKAA